MLQEFTGRPADVLKQNEDSAHGGDGWVPREGSRREELGSIWESCGVAAEWYPLRTVLTHRPGWEIDDVSDYRSALWLAPIDAAKAREQHDAFMEVYLENNVKVLELGEVGAPLPNSYFCRDTFCMTPDGAVISRMASASRAGEERWAAAALAREGVPIVHSVDGDGTFEGADVVVANEDLVFVGLGMRSNRSGVQQVARAFRDAGVAEVIEVEIPYGCGHIDGTINVVDKDLAMVMPTQLSWVVYENLKRHGFTVIDLPDMAESQGGMALNIVPLRPRTVVTPAENVRTKALLEQHGVEVLEVDVSELMKGGGSCHCMTGVVWRA